MYHIPALLSESIDALAIQPDGIYVDVTFGGGGHSRAILEKLSPKGRLFAFDQDPDAISNSLEDSRFQLIQHNFKQMTASLASLGIHQVDGILADLGVSFHQFDVATRGFSFRNDGPLDMRMNTKEGNTAADILMNATEDELKKIFRLYSELPQPGKIARAIIAARKPEAFHSTTEFAELIRPLIPKDHQNQGLAKLFQGLRIAVNKELDVLEKWLEQTTKLVRIGGRLVVLSYHSLEDRMVKHFIRSGNLNDEIPRDFYGNKLVPWAAPEGFQKQPIVPTEEEIERNPRSRSAKLRVGERIAPQAKPLPNIAEDLEMY